MRQTFQCSPEGIQSIKRKLLHYGYEQKYFAFLDSHNYKNLYPAERDYIQYDFIAAWGAHDIIRANRKGFELLKNRLAKKKDWLFGILAYDLKNEVHELESRRPDGLEMPDLLFFIPKVVFYARENRLKAEYLSTEYSRDEIAALIKKIEKITADSVSAEKHRICIKARTQRQEYLKVADKLREHIRLGDIYEINYCTEFYSEEAEIYPPAVYEKLMALSPTPFSAYFRADHQYLISAAPERFIRKTGNRIISQPVKGTAPRGKNPEEDENLRQKLLNDPKERAENVMITDLVRNDLSVTAATGSVQVEELFGIYRFPQVFQMISTVCSELRPDKSPTEVLKAAFPAGSMTGAPKKSALELAEKYENFRRGFYAGNLGYFTPSGNFDFNVIIRSILYNSQNRYLSFSAGSALTYASDPEKEYRECLLKAEVLKMALR